MSEYYLAHHGILGQKWGIRRYQNKDGSYTEAGKKRYNRGVYNQKEANEYANYLNKQGKYAHRYSTRSTLGIPKYHVEEYTGDPNNLKDRKTQDNRIKKISSYSEKYSQSDEEKYGKHARKRIEKDIFSGESIYGARAYESHRHEVSKTRAKISGEILGSLVGIGVGAAAANRLTKFNLLTSASIGMLTAGIVSTAVKELTESGVMIANGYPVVKKDK